MPYGKSDIPDLRLERLQKLITSFMNSPNLVLMSLFSESDAASDVIKWEAQIGNRGMTPFAAPGAPAQSVAPIGVSQESAMAAYWKEKMYFKKAIGQRKVGVVILNMKSSQKRGIVSTDFHTDRDNVHHKKFK